MNVTYMFRATNRLARGLVDGQPANDIISNQSAHQDLSPDPLCAPTEPRSAASVAEPLLLIQAPNETAQPIPFEPTVIEKIEMPVTHGKTSLPAKYIPTDERVILIAKARGGIGATTLAVNLALEMQMQAKKRHGTGVGRVALVDLDVQLGNAGTFLDLADRGGMLALANLGPEPDLQAMRHAMVRHPSGLGVLAAPETAIPFQAFDVRRVAAMIDALAAENDVVIIDLPPALIDWLEPLLARAERLLMMTDLAVPSIVRARRIITMMTEDHPKLPVEIVVSHEKKPFRPSKTQRDAETALGYPLRHWLPAEAKLARQALDRGEPLIQLAPRCGWSKAVKGMAADLQASAKSGAKPTAQGEKYHV